MKRIDVVIGGLVSLGIAFSVGINVGDNAASNTYKPILDAAENKIAKLESLNSDYLNGAAEWQTKYEELKASIKQTKYEAAGESTQQSNTLKAPYWWTAVSSADVKIEIDLNNIKQETQDVRSAPENLRTAYGGHMTSLYVNCKTNQFYRKGQWTTAMPYQMIICK